MNNSAKKFDYKKEYKELYLPPKEPQNLLYAIIFTIKMSYKSDHQIKGFFDFVVPPLEGFWWQDGAQPGSFDYSRKVDIKFISAIRLPDFVTRLDFDWTILEATKKKQQDFSKVEFLEYDEGLSVQCMHMGAYDDEPATIESMHNYLAENGYALDIQNPRYHHEIYLSDPRRCALNNLKTVIRHPIKKV